MVGGQFAQRPPQSVVCLVIDRLSVGFLGPYGNCWVRTPALDRMAFESLVLDQCLAESPSLDHFCRACWQGLHPWGGTLPAGSLMRQLGATSVDSVLLTDEPEVAAHRLAGHFDHLLEWPPAAAAEPVARLEDAHLIQVFARLFACLEELRPPFLLWCHLGSLGRCWDAPLELREQYCEQGDPAPYPHTAVPHIVAEQPLDLDELLPAMHAYAGQIAVLDTCLGALMEAMADLPCGASTMVAVVSPRGMPMGEHRCVGPADDAIYSELAHVPMLLRFPEGTGASVRCECLVQPGDLLATFCDWWNLPLPESVGPCRSLLPLAREEEAEWRDRVAVAGAGKEQAIRTPAWYLRQTGQGEQAELFVKPDDRWDQNDVSDRCPELVETLGSLLDEYRAWITSGQRGKLSPLEEILVTGPQ